MPSSGDAELFGLKTSSPHKAANPVAMDAAPASTSDEPLPKKRQGRSSSQSIEQPQLQSQQQALQPRDLGFSKRRKMSGPQHREGTSRGMRPVWMSHASSLAGSLRMRRALLTVPSLWIQLLSTIFWAMVYVRPPAPPQALLQLADNRRHARRPGALTRPPRGLVASQRCGKRRRRRRLYWSRLPQLGQTNLLSPPPPSTMPWFRPSRGRRPSLGRQLSP